MRIVQINMLHNGSTGKIMLNIANLARKYGHDVWTFSPIVHYLHSQMETPSIKGHTYFGSRNENMLHRIFDKILGINGMFSTIGTKQMLKILDEIKPDIIHLHNLHNCTIDLRSLFDYIKKNRIKVVWTLHDCWAITGRCPHYEMVKCYRWKEGCGKCPQLKEYPSAYIDSTQIMWKLKKRWFLSADPIILTSPSQWLADQIKQSFLKECRIRVINNGIALDVFRPTDNDFRLKYHCEHKKIVLGVAMGWGVRKGLDVFCKLAERLPNDYQIVLVGGNEETDSTLPSNVISIHRTQNQRELAEIYTAADVFVNPTREDTFPTVNIEAIACGTPVITFRTGGSPEIIDETCGSVVECYDVDALEKEILRVCTTTPYASDACIERAKRYNQMDRFAEYISLYEEMADH